MLEQELLAFIAEQGAPGVMSTHTMLRSAGRNDLTGVRPVDGAVEEKPAQGEAQRPAVLLNLFLGGGSEPVRVVDGQARPAGKPVRLAGEAIRQIEEPGSDNQMARDNPVL